MEEEISTGKFVRKVEDEENWEPSIAFFLLQIILRSTCDFVVGSCFEMPSVLCLRGWDSHRSGSGLV